MKQKIERFSKGNFEYELPSVCLSEDEITLSAETGKIYKGSFIVSNSMQKPMKGNVYSSNIHMMPENSEFCGISNEIRYQFDAVSLKEDETISGEWHIISDCGEKTLPFTVHTEQPYHMTSLGKIKDLYQFINLARMDWSEAKKIFRSEDFERIFLHNEERYRSLYRSLIKSVSTSQALEEFLVAIQRKSAILLEIDKTSLEYQDVQEKITDKLVLTKNNWGYAEIRVSTDSSFIMLEQKFLWADRFIGNTNQVLFTVDPQQLKHGKNYGHIDIKTPHQTITVDVLCRVKREDHKANLSRLKHKAEVGLVNNYLNFRLNRITLEKYLEAAEAAQKMLPGPEINHVRELIKLHLLIAAGKTKLAGELLADMAEEVPFMRKKAVPEYCFYLYLEALFRKTDEMVQAAADTIRGFYEKGYNDWRILWMLLYTDKSYEKNKAARLADIKEQFITGCRSPILYYEAVIIYNEEPFLLRELTLFEIQVCNYGIKNRILSKDAAQQYIYLTNKKKTFDPVIYHGLEKLYEEYKSEEILSAICCLLIKGMKKSPKYFKWFRLGAQAQLRITELYEYYMYTVDDSVQEPLAQPVLLYFIYNSNLNDRKKAFLYANIIKNKDKNESIYRSYARRMEVFALKMLEGHYINHDLAVLYKEFIAKKMPDAELSQHLPYIMYRNEIICKNPGMINVVVIHQELGTEETVPLVNGKAQADIYTGSSEIFLSDSFGNRYTGSVVYEVTPYMNSEEYESFCIDNCSHPMLLLSIFERYQSMHIQNESAVNLRKKVLQIEGLQKQYETGCCQSLIEYYYEKGNDVLLKLYLNKMELSMVHSFERTHYIEFMIDRCFYDNAFEAIELFGPDELPAHKLVRLCSGWLNANGLSKKQDGMVSLCHYVFILNKYDETTLKYLIRFFNGTTEDMLRLWKASREFELDTHNLDERLLTQILFSESNNADSFGVFCPYYKAVHNHLLVRAYLSYYAYRYFVHDSEIAADLFPIMKRELNYEENDVCLLAWLKKNASAIELSERDQQFAQYNLDRLVSKGITLPFFREYGKWFSLPDRILGKSYITYCCSPDKHVFIHYRWSKSDGNYIEERMPDCFMGIHVKEFILFHHEEIQYYITEESETDTMTTEEFFLRYQGEISEDNSKFSLINKMLNASERKEDSLLLDQMTDYVRMEFLADACFKPL